MTDWTFLICMFIGQAVAFWAGWYLRLLRSHRRLAAMGELFNRAAVALREPVIPEDALRAALPVPDDIRDWADELTVLAEDEGQAVGQIADALDRLADSIEGLFVMCRWLDFAAAHPPQTPNSELRTTNSPEAP